jgi:hypothetical protein
MTDSMTAPRSPSAGEAPQPRRRDRGQSLVEFGLIVPVIAVMLMGAIDFGRLFYAQMAVTNASRVGAEFLMDSRRCTSVGQGGNLSWIYPDDVYPVINAEAAPGVTFSQILLPAEGGCVTNSPGFTVTVKTNFQFATPLMPNVLGVTNPYPVTGRTQTRSY